MVKLCLGRDIHMGIDKCVNLTYFRFERNKNTPHLCSSSLSEMDMSL